MSLSPKPVLSIIIPTKGRLNIFSETFNYAINAIRNFDAEIIVVNDSPYELDKKFERSDNVRIFNNKGKGVATARNFGADKAKGDLLLFLDNDMWLNEENVKIYLKLYNELGDVIINLNWEYPAYLKSKLVETALGRYLVSKNFTTMKGWNKGNNWNDEELFESSGIAGANLLISRKNYRLLNGYNETFPFAGFEDFDFSERVKKSGIKTYIYPKSMMFHNEANKLELKGWLRKNYNSAITKKHAVNIGYSELKQNNSMVKLVIYFLMMPFSSIFVQIANVLARFKSLDKLYQKLVDALTGLYIFKGYNGYSY